MVCSSPALAAGSSSSMTSRTSPVAHATALTRLQPCSPLCFCGGTIASMEPFCLFTSLLSSLKTAPSSPFSSLPFRFSVIPCAAQHLPFLEGPCLLSPRPSNTFQPGIIPLPKIPPLWALPNKQCSLSQLSYLNLSWSKVSPLSLVQ